MFRCYGIYADAHRGKIKKASLAAFPVRIAEDKLQRIPSRGWAGMIRKVYEGAPMTRPKCCNFLIPDIGLRPEISFFCAGRYRFQD